MVTRDMEGCCPHLFCRIAVEFEGLLTVQTLDIMHLKEEAPRMGLNMIERSVIIT
jgi:hypothetical protein